MRQQIACEVCGIGPEGGENFANLSESGWGKLGMRLACKRCLASPPFTIESMIEYMNKLKASLAQQIEDGFDVRVTSMFGPGNLIQAIQGEKWAHEVNIVFGVNPKPKPTV